MHSSKYLQLIQQVEFNGDKALSKGNTLEGIEWYQLGLKKAKEAADKDNAIKFTRLLALLF